MRLERKKGAGKWFCLEWWVSSPKKKKFLATSHRSRWLDIVWMGILLGSFVYGLLMYWGLYFSEVFVLKYNLAHTVQFLGCYIVR